MPSGPKKRRAAKRKKEMEEQMKAPSPSDPPRDAGQSEDPVPHEGGEAADSQSPIFSSAPIFSNPLSAKESFGSDTADSAAESSKNLKDEDLLEEEVAFRPEDESAAKSDEVAESEKGYSKPAEEESTISVDEAICLTERNHATEFAARVLEETDEGGEADSQSPTFSSAPIFSNPLSSKEWFGSDVAASAAESSKNLKGEDLIEEDERELAPAVKTEDESAAKSDEVAESEKENSKPAEEESTISVDNAIGLTERSQATEFAARVLEETSGDNTERADGVFNHDGDGHQVTDETSPAIVVLEERNQVKEAAAEVLAGISGVDGEKESQLPDVDVGDGRQAAVGDETLPATELLHRSPLVDRRTNPWWNCCGLLDFVTNPVG